MQLHDKCQSKVVCDSQFAPLNCRERRLIRHDREGRLAQPTMPTLFRFLVTLGVIAALVYGAMFALATFVEPRKGEMTVRVPLDKLNKQQ